MTNSWRRGITDNLIAKVELVNQNRDIKVMWEGQKVPGITCSYIIDFVEAFLQTSYRQMDRTWLVQKNKNGERGWKMLGLLLIKTNKNVNLKDKNYIIRLKKLTLRPSTWFEFEVTYLCNVSETNLWNVGDSIDDV